MAQRLFPHLQVKFTSDFDIREGVEKFLDSILKRKDFKASSMNRGMALVALAGGVSACGVSTDTPGIGPTPPTPAEPQTLRAEDMDGTYSFTASVENTGIGGIYDDTFNGRGGSDTLNGGGGEDTLNGAGGDDALNGGDGDDTLNGGAGSDTFTASSGTDTITDYDQAADRLTFASYANTKFHDLTFTAANDADYNNAVQITGYETDTMVVSQVNLINALSGDIESLDEWFLQIADTQSQFNNALSGLTINYKDGNRTVTASDNGDTFNSNDAGRIFGFGGDDTITASSGMDIIYGGDGDDFLNGGGGDDVIYGGAGEDELNGGADKDTLRGGADDDVLNGGADNDMLFGDAGSDTLNGGAGDDTLEGGDGTDRFKISEGKDDITDYATSEILDFAEFKDSSDSPTINLGDIELAFAANDKDLLITGFGTGHTTTLKDTIGEDDIFHSMSINEILQRWTASRDSGLDGLLFEYINGGNTVTVDDESNTVTLTTSGTLFGFAGDDNLTGFSGDDTIFGGNGNDTLAGGGGDDELFGGSGTDIFYGGAGDDTLTGGSSNDTFNVSWGSDIITDFRSSGRDYIGFSALLNDDSISVIVGSTTFNASVSNLRFTSADADNDGEENDLLIMFNDHRISSTTIHTITLQDVFEDGGTFASYRTEEAGVFTFDMDGLINDFTNYGNSSSSSSFIRGLELTYGNETSDVTNDSNNTITLSASSNHTLYGLGGSDRLTGNVNDNIIYGGNGGDDINGGEGNDTLYGGAGSDDFYISIGSDTVQDFETRDDLFLRLREVSGSTTTTTTFEINDIGFAINAANSDDLDITYEANSATHTLTIKDLLGEDNPADFGNSLGEAIAELTRDTSQYIYELEFADDASSGTTFTATSGNDIFYGWQGDDELNGGAGLDKLYAGEGADELNGGDGADELYGSDGTDTLNGGADDDILSGGDDKDTFIVSSGEDTIIDYRTTGDRDIIDFSDATIGKLIFAIADDDNVVISGYQIGTADGTLILQDALLSGFGFSNDDLGQVVDSITANEESLTDIDEAGSNNDSPGYFRFAEAFTTNIGDDEDSTLTLNSNYSGETHFALGGDDTINIMLSDGASVFGGNGNDRLTGGVKVDYLYGGAGEDTIMGFGGDDILSGGNSSDTIDGGDGNDTIYGGGGSDVFTASAGTDTIADFTAFDDLNFSSSFTIAVNGLTLAKANSNADLQISGFTVGGLSGTFILAGAFLEDGIFYDADMSMAISEEEAFDMLVSDDDFITGITASPDTLDATSSGDRLFGFNGDDVLNGVAGAEWLFGGSGLDTLNGMGGNDILYGGDDADTLNGGDGEDKLYGGVGNDTLNANDGDDMLFGGSGTDTLRGGDGADTLNGDSGNDTITGGAGIDTFVVSSGADTYRDFTYSASGDVIDLAEFKREDADNTGSLTATLTLADLSFRENGENLELSGFGGTVIFEDALEEGAGIIDGTEGLDGFTDYFYGNLTNIDQFIRNFADDIATVDVIGDDTANTDLTATASETLFGFAGNDTLTANDGGSTIYGGDGNDTLNGDDGRDVLHGNIGNDTLNGGDGNDTLNGNVGDDTLNGGAGNDTLFGGKGDDILSGDDADNFGSDIFIISEGTDTITDFYSSNVETGERDVLNFSEFDNALIQNLTFNKVGDDLEIASYGAGNEIVLQGIFGTGGQFDGQDINTALDTLTSSFARLFSNLSGAWNDSGNSGLTANANDEYLFGFGGNDSINASSGGNIVFGGNGNDTINGAGGNDIFYGGNHADTIMGDDGDDTLYGGSGGDTLNGGDDDDMLFGGRGLDSLNGGDGDDELTGGAGRDTFIASAGSDTITDFNLADHDDMLDFSALSELSEASNITKEDLTARIIQNTDHLELVFAYDHDDDEETDMVTATVTLNDVVDGETDAAVVLNNLDDNFIF